MRELEFRAWKMHNGKLRRCVFSPFGILDYAHRHPEAPVMHNQEVNDIRDFMPDADVIEQSTGLKDKNGQKIYEGDIVTFMVECFDSTTLGFESEQWHTAVVEWNQDDACYSFMDGGEPFSVQFEAEVIGNIHENPEILEANDVD